MADFEKRNYESKEETLHFGDLNEETTRMVGCWMGTGWQAIVLDNKATS